MNDDTTKEGVIRAVSRHTLTYVLCSISELFRHYDFDPLDFLMRQITLNDELVFDDEDSKEPYLAAC